ncbi:MAG: hypothetical protein C4287_19935 [Leptolyngbya sp. ERB_1_2]
MNSDEDDTVYSPDLTMLVKTKPISKDARLLSSNLGFCGSQNCPLKLDRFYCVERAEGFL